MDPSRRRPSPPSTLPWLAVAAFAVTLTVNGLAVWLPLAGRSTEAISAMFPVLITPAGFTFAVWSVIYLALAAFVVHQARPAGRRDPRLRGLRGPFIASCVFNAGWLLAWHYLLIELSLVLMAGLLVSLLVAYRRLPAPGDTGSVLVRVPFGLYLAWISVASLVNARVVAYRWGWLGQGSVEEAATLAVVAAVAGVALWVLARHRDVAFAAVVAWASYGIRAANEGRPLLATGAAVAAVVVVAAALFVLGREVNRRIDRGRAGARG